MIVRAQNRRVRWFQHFRYWRIRRSLNRLMLLNEAEFVLCLDKERARSERRDLQFCVVQIVLPDGASRIRFLASLVPAFRNRLRITDEIGLFQNSLAILLPETSTLNAGNVATDLEAIAGSLGLTITTNISVYPESNRHDDFDSRRGESGSASNAADGFSNNGSTSEQGTTGKPSGSIDVLKFHRRTPIWKRSLDLVGSVLGLVFLSPVFAAAAIAIRLSSPGPIVFTQWREGKDGRRFKIFKFRTMRVGADSEQPIMREINEQDGPAFKIKDDPRLTSVGRYLRRTCIDELPQLINIVKGEMSLVGPRPLPVHESIVCKRWHRRRLDVLPGMTCDWQVHGGREIPFDEWMRMDLQYIANQNPLADFKLLCKTAMVTLLHRGSV